MTDVKVVKFFGNGGRLWPSGGRFAVSNGNALQCTVVPGSMVSRNQPHHRVVYTLEIVYTLEPAVSMPVQNAVKVSGP